MPASQGAGDSGGSVLAPATPEQHWFDAKVYPALGADRIELYTESYARAHERGEYEAVLAQFQEAAATATASGLGINAGHDLNLNNLRDFRIPNLLEVSIGHAFSIDALRWGIPETVRRYLETLSAL